MSALPLSVFKRRLTDLTREQFRDFVAALWSARGAEVAVEGDDILVSFGFRTRRLRTVHSATPVPTVSVSDSNLATVNMLVTSADSDRLRKAATAAGVGYMGPERLRKLALYAIDRERCESIFLRYFGRPVEEHPYRETPARRIEWMADVIEIGPDQSDSTMVSRPHPPWLGGLETAFVVLVLLTVTIGIGVGGAWHGGTALVIDKHATLNGSSTDLSPTFIRAEEPPPGFNGTRLANLSALVAAHEAALARRDYALELSQAHTRGITLTTDRLHSARHRVTVEGHDRRYTVEGLVPPSTIGDRPRPFEATTIVNESGCTVRLRNASRVDSDKEELCRAVRSNTTRTTFPRLTGTYITRYLDGSGRITRRFQQNGRTYYLLETTNPPEHFPDGTTKYRAIATVARSGLVENLTVSYETPRFEREERARFTFQVSRIESS